MSATILSFSAIQRDAAPRERLAGAVAAMDAALEAQRGAVGTWRGAIGDLRHAHAALESNLVRLRTRLDSLAVQATSRRTAWEDTLPDFGV